MIKSISCCGYRGFSREQTLNLAIPNGKDGSGLTVLIGPNSGGKSTLVECFKQISLGRTSFTEGKRNKLAGDKVTIQIDFDNCKGILSTVPQGGSETDWNCPGPSPKIYFLPSRRVFTPYFGKGEWDRGTFMNNPQNDQFRAAQQSNFTNRLFYANRKSAEFNEIFWRILGRKLEWTLDQDDNGQYYVKVKKDDSAYHNSDGLGEGIVSLLFLSDAIFEAQQDELIVIDEPELSLHPQLQARLLEELLNISKNMQIVISTHSPNMISMESTVNGGVIARVFEKENTSTIASIDEQCRKYFKSFSHDINNPHIIGSDARSCLFAEDGFIITEGQEDVMLLPVILEELGLTNKIPFFGFGAGGASKINNIAYILKILGFQKIGAIFDGDKKSDYEKFNADFADVGYQSWILPVDDIRDKEAITTISKHGVLNKDRNKINDDIDKDNLKRMFVEMSGFQKT
jgi:predicted ATPase